MHHSDGRAHRQQIAVRHLPSSCYTVAYSYVHSMLQCHAHCCIYKKALAKMPCFTIKHTDTVFVTTFTKALV